jgi:hypothetical protein
MIRARTVLRQASGILENMPRHYLIVRRFTRNDLQKLVN